MKKWKKWWNDHEWSVLVFLALLSVLFGYCGFALYYRETGSDISVPDLFYLTLQLFTFGSGFLDAPVPVWLNIARFLAPATLAFAAIKAFLWLLRDQLRLLRLRHISHHVILAGANAMTSRLIQDLLKSGKKVVVVDHIIAIPDEIKLNRNLLVVCGDPGEVGMLQQARCSYASALICLTPDDTINLSAAITAAGLQVPEGSPAPPDIYCHLSGTRTIERLNSLDFFRKQRLSNGYERQSYIQGFNVYERASRLLLEEYAPDKFVPALHSGDHQPRLAVAGLSILGEALVMQMARMAHYAGLKKTRVTIIEQSPMACEEWIKAYPAVKDILEIHFIHDLSENLPAKEMDTLFVCYDQYADTLDLLHNLTPQKEITCPVIIATNQQTSFLQAYRASNVYHFSVFDQTLSADAILREKIDDLARIIHAAYLDDQKEGKTFNPSKETHQDWQNLPERTKNQNRNQADHLWIKVRAAGCLITPIHDEGSPFDFTSDADLYERLSEVEHNRWMAHERLSDPGSRHESLVPYAALTDQVKQWDRNAVKNIPALLARLGLKPVKKPVSQ